MKGYREAFTRLSISDYSFEVAQTLLLNKSTMHQRCFSEPLTMKLVACKWFSKRNWERPLAASPLNFLSQFTSLPFSPSCLQICLLKSPASFHNGQQRLHLSAFDSVFIREELFKKVPLPHLPAYYNVLFLLWKE